MQNFIKAQSCATKKARYGKPNNNNEHAVNANK